MSVGQRIDLDTTAAGSRTVPSASTSCHRYGSACGRVCRPSLAIQSCSMISLTGVNEN